jgi:hypothetical protein
MNQDHRRAYFLYRYLLLNLGFTDKPSGQIYAQKIRTRVGGDNQFNRLISPLKSEQDWLEWSRSTHKRKTDIEVSTSYLVEKLTTLRKNLEKDYAGGREPYNRILTQEDILLALYKLIELTYEERTALGLQNGDGFTLLKQTLLTLQSSSRAKKDETILQNYKAAIGLEPLREDHVIKTLSDVDKCIEQSVDTALRYLSPREPNDINKEVRDKNKKVRNDLTRTVKRESRNLLARSGITRFPTGEKHPYIQKHLQPAFIRKLTQTLVNNKRLTAQFPVYLNRVTIEACGPLPFADANFADANFADANLKSSETLTSYPSLLNKEFQVLDLPFSQSEITGPSEYHLASQGASKIVLEFYLKVPEPYTSSVHDIVGLAAPNCTDKNKKYRRIDFTVSSTGIGGTLSHATKVVNIILLADIACLSSFFPTAHDVTAISTIVGDNVSSPVWAHSLVKLCQKKALGEALDSFEEAPEEALDSQIFLYDKFSFGDPIGRGDFFGFDFLTTQVQASIKARLQAIKNAGVNPKEYIDQLCKKVEKQKALEQAQQYLTSYPFSTLAMVSVIQKSILGGMPDQEKLSADSPHIDFIACLSIAEVFLQEGAYRKASEYLKKIDVLKNYVKDSSTEVDGSEKHREERTSFVNFSGTLLVRYLLCKATYYYLFDDTGDSDLTYLPEKYQSGVRREQLVELAWGNLNKAYEQINTRSKRYLVLDEISQGTLHPHYELLSRIHSTQAKLLFFFPEYGFDSYKDIFDNDIGNQRIGHQRLPKIHWGRLYLMEKARLYTAADGNSDKYAIFSAIQSCLYLIAAYDEKPENLNLNLRATGANSNLKLTPEACINWARTLRNHALIAYADTGRQCYYSIKQKSGLSRSLRHKGYGDYLIFTIPTIFEVKDSESENSRLNNSRESRSTGETITLDMSLLCVDIENLPKLTSKHPTDDIYLFGANACYLFFARGLFLLCSDTTDEDFEGSENNSKVQSPEQWESKFKKALRLFDMAWVIAEDGGKITQNTTESENLSMTIKRYPPGQDRGDQYTSPEIEDVRDLYLCRVSEIADLGKILSAACMTLYLHTLPSAKRPEIEENIDKIFSMLHGEYNLENSKELLNGQKRFNGHLDEKLKLAKGIIQGQEKPKLDQPSSHNTIKRYRDQLMRKLFALTHRYPDN